MSANSTGGWLVWRVYQKRAENFKKVSKNPWGCVGMLAVVLLFWQGLAAALAAMFLGQVLPILLLLFGQLPMAARILKLAKESQRPCPDKDATAPFLGRLTERGLQLVTGKLASWSTFSSWTPGWEDSHVFRIHLRLAAGQDSRTLMQIQPKKWLFANVIAVVAALYLAWTLPGHGKALQACLFIGSAYLALFLLRSWSGVAMRRLQADTPEEPWVLIFDSRQVSMAEVEALLERHLPVVSQRN